MATGGKRSREGKSQKGHLRVVPTSVTTVALAPDLDPWERQPNETDAAYAGFIRYRDLPADGRSIRAAHEGAGEHTAHIQTWTKWSAKWSWVDRVLAWDDEMDRVRRDAHRASITEMSERHAQAGQVYISTILQPAIALLKKCRDEPNFMADLIANNPMGAFGMIERLAKALPLVVNVERLARGEPLNIEEIEARLTDVDGARDVSNSILNDPEAAKLADDLIARLYGVGS